MKTKENVSTKKLYKVSTMGGISLIVLVITIIVIIILAVAVVVSIINNNPMSEANRARYQSDRANMQAILTNTVGKIMAESQETIKVDAKILVNKEKGPKNVVGETTYKFSDETGGKIVFDNKKKEGNDYYTGKKLPVYKPETTWYVNEEAILTLRVGNTEYTEEGDKTNNGEIGGGEVLPPLQAEVGEIVKTSAKEYKDKDGKVAVVPIGFAVVPGKDVIKDGLVISDVANDTGDIGNQFVWIPVEDMSTFVREAGYYNGQIQTADNFYIDFEKCEEPYNGSTESERKEYENIIASVEEYKGFYIGRYEMSQSEDGSGKAQSKKNKTPWVNIMWGNNMTDLYGGIVGRARSMYPYREDIKKGQVISTLMYGVTWDQTIRFLKTNENYKNIDKDSSGFGNLGINCDAGGYDGTNSAIQTGSNETYCLNNIYDFVGNVWEWTMETYNGQSADASLGRIFRGGVYHSSGYYCPVSSRGNVTSTTFSFEHLGGRIQLYIK